MKTNYKRIFAIAKIILGIAIPLILLILPSDYFDSGSSKCLSVMLFDAECYGCGTTRAIMHLLHGDFMEAFYYNMASFIVLPLLIFLGIKNITENVKLLRG
jgi:Protein of unknown function (DUF2752)